jgi:arginine decarboxylase
VFVPKRIFLTKGVGVHREKLHSFELALRDAGIEAANLVRVSSIFPPGCRMISKEKGLKELSAGQILFVVISEASTDEPHRQIAASVGLAIPTAKGAHGYLSEHHSYGQNEKIAGDYAEDLAAEMLATIQGVEFNPEMSWDEKRELWKISGKIVRTRSITQAALGNRRGFWTTVISAAVLLD